VYVAGVSTGSESDGDGGILWKNSEKHFTVPSTPFISVFVVK
jgi:hypothetical protein